MSKFYTNVFARNNKIYYRGYNNGKRLTNIISYTPYLFISADKESKTEYKTLTGFPVKKLMFDSMSEAKDFIGRYNDVANMEFFGLTNFPYLFIYDNYPGIIDFDLSLIRISSLDIEVDSSNGFPSISEAEQEIISITFGTKDKKIVFGLKPYTPKDSSVIYVHCKNEIDLLSKFIAIWKNDEYIPDIVTGWNIEFFDLPYLVNRITKVLSRKHASEMSPFGFLEERNIEIRGRDNQTFTPAGINVLDYYNLYKKFKFEQQENYRLETIAEVEELDVKKLDYKAEGYVSLDDLYNRNFELFIDYNIMDTVVVDKLEEKLKFIELVLAFAYDAKVNYADTLTTVKPWDIIIHNYLLDRAIVIPQFKKGNFNGGLVGGYVKEPNHGLNKWVVSFDLNSLYPHLIMQYNISTETYVGRDYNFPSIEKLITGDFSDIDKKYSNAANGTKYKKDKQGFLPALMEKMYNDRVEFKNNMIEAKKKLETVEKNSDEYKKLVNDVAKYHSLQLAKKIQLNSAYGALGNEWFRWFSFDMAEAITVSGQLSIRWIEKRINAYLNKLLSTNKDYIVASDTDSIYVNMEPLAKLLGVNDNNTIVNSLDRFCEEKLQKVINEAYNDLYLNMNAYAQKMFMKRETIAEKGIWKAKKMYILNAWDVEGVRYAKPKLKIQGIEAVRSSTPKACRKSIKKCLEVIMNEGEEATQKYINDFKLEFMKMPFNDVAFPRGMNGLSKYKDKTSIYTKGTPIHVKGALLYNNAIKSNKLDKIYPLIGDGDKIKFSYLKEPNPIRDSVIAVFDELPKELGLQNYIDYETQFNKAFLEPIKSILNVIGWEVEKKNTLEDFFS